MEWWQVGAAANGVVAVAYFAICYAIFVPLHRAGELGSNRLGTATGLIFFSCAVGHGLHSAHLLLPSFGVSSAEAEVGRAVELHDATWTVFTAIIGVYYWTLRRSYGRLLEGAVLFQDQAGRQREAVEVNDSIVQSLVAARMARRLGRDDEVDAALDAALDASRELVEQLLHDATGGRAPVAGDFVRGQAVSGAPP